MITNGKARKIDLPLCDARIFEHGDYIAILDAKPEVAEELVRKIAKDARARVDWHCIGNRIYIMHLGKHQSLARLCVAIDKLPIRLKRTIVELFV